LQEVTQKTARSSGVDGKISRIMRENHANPTVELRWCDPAIFLAADQRCASWMEKFREVSWIALAVRFRTEPERNKTTD
jgi:hypothetical protein